LFPWTKPPRAGLFAEVIALNQTTQDQYSAAR
jgi:hypothetical protein